MLSVLIALEAGCRQAPEAGTAIGLSGTVFTHKTVTITDPTEDSDYRKHNKTSLSSAAIAGIVVAVVVVFVVALGLLLCYFHRAPIEPDQDVWEDDFYDSQPASANNMYAARSYKGSPQNHQFQPTLNGSEKTASVGSSGEYYDRMLAKEMYERQEVYPMHTLDPVPTSNSIPRSSSFNSSGLPAHPAYIPGTVSRNNSPVIHRGRDLAAPQPTHTRVRSNTPDSFAEQAYLQAAEDSARLATATGCHSPAPPAASAAPGAPGAPPYETKKRVAKIAILNLPKIAVPKPGKSFKAAKAKASPPVYTAGDPGISGPIMNTATDRRRFTDTPLGGPVAISTSPPPPRPITPEEEEYHYDEVPLRSGKSFLYG